MSANTQLDHQNDAGHPARTLDIGAIIFVATVIFSLVGIAFLARNIFSAAQHLESAKRNAELVALQEEGVRRAEAGQQRDCRVARDCEVPGLQAVPVFDAIRHPGVLAGRRAAPAVGLLHSGGGAHRAWIAPQRGQGE